MGEITLTPDQVREYTAIAKAGNEPSAADLAMARHKPALIVENLPLEAVAATYGRFAHLPVTVTNRVRMVRVSLRLAAPTDQAMASLIEAGLRRQGISVVHSPAGISLDQAVP